ncbi:unnamed protein product [Effrenium voratum]|nr:unnamed protein product [Effrenium voratum]
MAKGISAGMASDLYCASTTNIGDTILLKIEETHERQQHLLTQILNALQQDVAPHRHAVQRLSEPVKPTRHSVKKRSVPLSSTSIVQGQVPSMMEMHLDLLRELGSHLDSSSHSLSPSKPSPSFHTFSSVDEGSEVDIIPRPHLILQDADEPDSEIPGLVGDASRFLNVPRPNRGSRMHSMDKSSQVQILESHSNLTPLEVQPTSARGFRLLEEHPILLYFLIGSPALAMLVVVLGFTIIHHQMISYGFTVFTTALYFLLALGSIFLLGRALRSSDLHLATSRLNVFVSDFKLRWTEVSGKEGWKYAAAWCFMMMCFSVTQGCEAFLTQTEEASPDVRAWKHVIQVVSSISFGVSSAVVMLSAYIQSHLLLGLDKSLDCWCCRIVNDVNFSTGVESWNAMQALLKCVGRELASSFVALQALATLGFIYFLASCMSSWRLCYYTVLGFLWRAFPDNFGVCRLLR